MSPEVLPSQKKGSRACGAGDGGTLRGRKRIGRRISRRKRQINTHTPRRMDASCSHAHKLHAHRKHTRRRAGLDLKAKPPSKSTPWGGGKADTVRRRAKGDAPTHTELSLTDEAAQPPWLPHLPGLPQAPCGSGTVLPTALCPPL